MKMSWAKLLLLLGLLALSAAPFARAEDETDEETIDAEGEAHGDDVVEETEGPKLSASPDAETSLLFVKPVIAPDSSVELPAGKVAEIIVGFHNKANYDFVIDTLDASFRFPMDYNYYLQNFSAIPYDFTVKPGQHGSVHYAFIPAEAFGSRSYGLNIRLTYHDLDGNYYSDAVFNQTIPIVELDEGLDTEIFFLYVFLAGFVILLFVLGHQFLSWGKKKTIGATRSSKPRPKASSGSSSPVETGTKKADDVDFDWIPKETIQEMNRASPKTPTRSPRARKAKRSAASSDDD